MKEKPSFTGQAKKPGERDPDICVVTCAVTGVLANRKQNPGIPYTPVEIAEECKRAYDAGASVVHIHARNDEGGPTFSPAVFARIKEEVRARCPIILNFSTGTILDDVTDQCTYVRESKPEIAALNMGTMNYAKYSPKRKQFDFDMVFPNTYSKIIKLLEVMNEAGVKPELECFDTGHTNGIAPLLDMGVLRPPLQFSFIVNVLGGIPAHVESLQLQTKIMPAGSEWEVIGISHGAWRMIATALVLGGNVRCGLEDHFYLPNGEMAKSNGELVETAVRLVRDVGRRPATVEEAREILSLGAPR
ncbi:3-keto-5-aminohexanoate cleavage protein [Polyangium sp. y55x31]|uniref:3-keto-5-aminohexanoate cleavage protein n=1 Tax=Polyangium sp. y55x31 TaxID=3042688 RepID=UPI0024831F1E|nr:3-keto-5-aminohexanoate cleavage protein [Polyangium sp. y55x31]MDI1481256.1 3-keto-5-aminohexanoate cleavage protein [Polyangium sp. y55x31]